MPHKHRWLFVPGVPLFAAFITCATLVPALFMGKAPPTTAVVFTGLTALFLLGFLPLFARRMGPRVFGTVAGVLLGVALAAGLGCARSWRALVLVSHYECGTEDAMLRMMSPLLVGGPIAVGGLLGGILVRRVRARGRASVIGLILIAALGCSSVASVVNWTLRSPRYASIEEWLGDGAGEQRLEFTLAERAGVAVRELDANTRLERDCGPVDPHGVEGAPEPRRCVVRLRATSATWECRHQTDRRCPPIAPMSYPAEAALVVRHDAATGLWLVFQEGSERAVAFNDTEPLFHFHDGDHWPVAVSRADLGRLIRAPLAAVVLALVGLLLSLGLLFLWRSTLRAHAAAAAGRAGWSDGSEVRFDDAKLPAQLALTRPVTEGPVVVCAAPAATAGYRDTGRLELQRVFEGSREHVLGQLATRATGQLWLAIAVLAVTCIPLLCM